ncbi:MAG TPA: acyltransferase [Opitutaceae bacterium]|nr:acyltransferase [Opitutaceae bacterium]
MGILRVILALSVVVAHVGPLFGLRFFGGGVMGVETFYMVSGFYMALVLSTRYRGRTRDFYFNRFLRLFPVYWLLVATFFVCSALYWLAVGHPLGALVSWQTSSNPFHWLWAGISNLALVGADWAELYSYLTTVDGDSVNRLIAIQPVWSLAVEITFYLASPFILRLSFVSQGAVFLAALLVRVCIWVMTGSHWTVWIYYFAPATWVFFMGGVQAFHLMAWLEKQNWFARTAFLVGRALVVLLVLLIVFYAHTEILRFQDWRYYTVVGLSLPFIFAAFKDSGFDAALGAWSYPIYLAHWVIRAIEPPLRHFVPLSSRVYIILLLTLLLCFAVLQADKKIQHRFKRTA